MNDTRVSEPKWQTVPEVASSLGVAASTVQRWIVRGIRGIRLAAVRVGGHWRVDPADLARFHAAQTELAVGNPDAVVITPKEECDAIARAARERVRAMLG